MGTYRYVLAQGILAFAVYAPYTLVCLSLILYCQVQFKDSVSTPYSHIRMDDQHEPASVRPPIVCVARGGVVMRPKDPKQDQGIKQHGKQPPGPKIAPKAPTVHGTEGTSHSPKQSKSIGRNRFSLADISVKLADALSGLDDEDSMKAEKCLLKEYDNVVEMAVARINKNQRKITKA